MTITAEQLNEFSAFAEFLADAAAAAIQPHFRQLSDIGDKGGRLFDPVTVADTSAERAMRNLIATHYPNHGILGEEEGVVHGTSELTWVLDPIDGTRAFVTGLPLWGTLIALNDGQQPILGLMNQPFTRERFIGTSCGSFCNGVKIKTRPCDSLSNATLMCTTPEMFETPRQQAAFQSVADKVRLLRYGGDCYAYCMLASGFVDIIIEADLKPYDVQALIPIIEGAGGIITSWDGSSAQNGGTVVACGDPRLHHQVLGRLRHGI